jgi:nucleoside-diphosphate-sugar epimerase
MTTIGIIGASGQVGTEVCLFLKTYPGVRPVALVRSEISGAMLRRLQVEARLCDLRDEGQCKQAFADCDLLADFSVAPGEAADTTAHYDRNIPRALECAPGGARYVFISSINAFGMSAKFNRAKNYWLPHTIYAYTKRYGERLALRLGKRVDKETYVFRLGHVHGLLQRVSEETRQLARGRYRRFEYPDTPSYTIFCHTIAEGLVCTAQGRERPGIYTLISDPAWTWREVLDYYADPGRRIEVELPGDAARGGILGRAVNALRSSAMGSLNDYRESIRTNVLRRAPSFERRAAARLYVRRAKQQIQEFQNQSVYRPQGVHEGIFPGPRLAGISDSRVSMAEKTEQVREMLQRLPAETSRGWDRICLPQSRA